MHKLRDSPGGTEEGLRAELEALVGEGRVYVLGLGNVDRADDGAGVLVALALKKRFPSYSYSEHDGVEGTVLDLSEKPEDLTALFVDAADLGLKPGMVALVRKERIRDKEVTTHRVAVALMASILEKAGKRSAAICIQPETIEFRGAVSEEVRKAVNLVTDLLAALMESRD